MEDLEVELNKDTNKATFFEGENATAVEAGDKVKGETNERVFSGERNIEGHQQDQDSKKNDCGCDEVGKDKNCSCQGQCNCHKTQSKDENREPGCNCPEGKCTCNK